MKKPSTSFRLPADTLEHLDERARLLGENRTKLVERYVEEGLRRDEHPAIVFREGAAGRRPALAGTRLDVWQVVETVRNEGNSTAGAAEYLGIPEEQVQACVRYYAAHQDEVDEWAARMRELAEREEA